MLLGEIVDVVRCLSGRARQWGQGKDAPRFKLQRALLSLVVVPIWLLAETTPTVGQGVVLSELMAASQNQFADDDGDFPDWLELHNSGEAPVDLTGWSLTDARATLKRWTFPSIQLGAGQSLVVFASGKARAVPGAPLHTSFSLSAEGEYVALVGPDGATVVSEMEFPPQRPNVSYGWPESVPAPQGGVFFSEPTPGQLNGNGAAGWLERPLFSAARGFYSQPFSVALTVDPPEAEIRYTLDGSLPSAPRSVMVTVSPPDKNGASSGPTGLSRLYDSGTVVQLEAEPTAGGNVFQKWQEDGIAFSTNSTVTVTLDRERALEAVYRPGSLAPHTVAEAADYRLVYSWDVPTQADYSKTGVPYELNDAAQTPPFNRVAYYLELQPTGNASRQFLWVSMDAFTAEVAKIGVPTLETGAFFQQPALNMNIRTSVPEMVTGDGLAGGQLEFWAGNYDAENEANAPGASEAVYDFGDRATSIGSSGYGSMQVHNAAANQTLFAVNGWGGAEGFKIDLGIGNYSGQNPDWTFAQNAESYQVRKLQVYILPNGSPNAAGSPQPSADGSPVVQTSRPNSLKEAHGTESWATAMAQAGSGPYVLRVLSSHPDSARLYREPIEIKTTRTLRAAAFRPGWLPSKVETQTYLFINDILHQSASIPGYPQPVMETGHKDWISQPITLDYEMDPAIVDAPAYRDLIAPAMRSIPTLSLVGNVQAIFGPSGVYYGTSASQGPEEPVSMELLFPDNPTLDVQANAGLRPQSHPYVKRSFRLLFRQEYGDGSLKSGLWQETPWNRGSAGAEFDRLILRGGGNRSFVTRWNPDDTCYTRDEWVRASQVAMSGYGSHGTFVHLYLNGLYWGLYNPVERPDHFFAATYFGGEPNDYFAINHDGPVSGNSSRWTYLTGDLVNKDMAVPANYQELKQYLDVEQFCDYLLLNWYAGTSDWPQNNWYAAMRVGPSPGPVRFFAWDAEDVWDNESTSGPFDCVGCEGGRGHDGAWVPPEFLRAANAGNGPAIARLFHAAKASPDFLFSLADRAARHVRSGGALSDTNAQTRWIQLNESIREAVIGESARWGDARETLPGETGVIRDRDGVWQKEYLRVLNESMPGNAARLIAALRAQGYYPDVDPPQFSPADGIIKPGARLVMTSTGGLIYYSLDGSDPRGAGTGETPSIRLYTEPIPLTGSARVKARVLTGQAWSALTEADFGGVSAPVRITEIMYHPPDLTEAESAAGFTDPEEFEFLELQNLGSSDLNLAGYRFAAGITFTFGETRLAPGGYSVLAKNPWAFAARYGNTLPVLGPFEGNLNNAGERILLAQADGTLVQEFTYDDAWYPLTDGGGRSLEIIDPRATLDSWNQATNWAASLQTGGSPGRGPKDLPRDGPESLAAWQERHFGLGNPLSSPGADPDGDGLTNLVEYSYDLNPLSADRTSPITVRIRRHPVDNLDYLELSFPRRKTPREVTYAIEISDDAQQFRSEPEHLVEAEVSPHSNGQMEIAVFRILPSVNAFGARFVRITIRG